jgi:integrase
MNSIQLLIQRAIGTNENADEVIGDASKVDLEKKRGRRRGSIRMPVRRKNKDVRIREFLTESEVDALQNAANTGRFAVRNATMIMMAFRHGLRVTELISLRWEQVDFEQELLYVKRLKNGIDATHPLRVPELVALMQLKGEQNGTGSGYIFTSLLGDTMTTSNFRKMLDVAAAKAKLDLKIHPHMLRHACGHYLANKGEDTRAIQVYMGHANIQNTTHYTELSAGRFKGFFKD